MGSRRASAPTSTAALTTLSLDAYAGKRLGPVDAELSHWQAQGTVQYLDFLLNPLDQDFRDADQRETARQPRGRLDQHPAHEPHWTS